MKYKVIGWTNYKDEKYPILDIVTKNVEDAIIDNLIETGYMFSGKMHLSDNKKGCPVLNNGYRVVCSEKEWNTVIIRTLLKKGNGVLDREKLTNVLENKIFASRYPKNTVNDKLIVKEEEILENFEFLLGGRAFYDIKNGNKTFFVKLYDELGKDIDVGDNILFVREEDVEEKILTKVEDIVISKDIKTLLNYKIYPYSYIDEDEFFSKENHIYYACGFDSLRDGVIYYYDKLSDDEVIKNGVMAIKIKVQ